MRTLDRYVFKEIVTPSVIALTVLTFVFFSREIGSLLEVIVRQSATFSELWAFSLAILPSVLTFTIPMAVLVGILTGFGRISSDSEAIAFRACGISMKRLLLPVMLDVHRVCVSSQVAVGFEQRHLVPFAEPVCGAEAGNARADYRDAPRGHCVDFSPRSRHKG